MKVKVINESGWVAAVEGISLSYNSSFESAERAAYRLASKDGGHNKFLESMMVWLDITAPRYWWQEFDTYRVGVTKQSESTMHTLMKGPLTQMHFEEGVDPGYLEYLNELIASGDFVRAKSYLPEGFLQRRIVCLNYKVLRNMMQQRRTHRLSQWRLFITSVINNVQWPDYLEDIMED